jgi:nucleoside phosphorylase
VLGIVTGLKSEAQLVRGLDVMCISTGGRAHIARAKIDRLVSRGLHGLVSFGIAGALSPNLKCGDLVIADKVVGGSGESWPAHRPWIDAVLQSVAPPRNGGRPDDVPHHAAARRSEGQAHAAPEWLSAHDDAREILPAQIRGDGKSGVRVGAMLGLDRMLSTPEEKAAAFARSSALAVDMESHHLASAATERGLPFIAIRAISDEAHEALPAILAGFVDTEGRTKMSAVVAALILGRVGVGELLQAGRASKRAHQALLRCRGTIAGLR